MGFGGILNKVFLLLFMSNILIMADCKYVSDPNIYVRKMIKSIKDLKLESNVYCDENNEKMVYYHSNNYNDLDIGLIREVKSIDGEFYDEDVLEALKFLLKDSNSLVKKYTSEMYTVKSTYSNFEELPNNFHMRLYMSFDEDPYMFGKITISIEEGENTLYFVNEQADFIKLYYKGNYYLTDDIIF